MNSQIKDIMSRDVECATPGMSVREAADRMKSRNIGSMPVCEGKKVVGVITDRDITIRSTAGGSDPNETKVGSIMSRDVACVKPDDSVRDAEQIMHDRQLRRLCVVDDHGDLVGYLAIAKIARQESPSQAGRVFRGVSQPTSPKKLAEIAVRKGTSKS